MTWGGITQVEVTKITTYTNGDAPTTTTEMVDAFLANPPNRACCACGKSKKRYRVCKDKDGWVDKWGQNCQWYTAQGKCDHGRPDLTYNWREASDHQSLSALRACCACSGGAGKEEGVPTPATDAEYEAARPRNNPANALVLNEEEINRAAAILELRTSFWSVNALDVDENRAAGVTVLESASSNTSARRRTRGHRRRNTAR